MLDVRILMSDCVNGLMCPYDIYVIQFLCNILLEPASIWKFFNWFTIVVQELLNETYISSDYYFGVNLYYT